MYVIALDYINEDKALDGYEFLFAAGDPSIVEVVFPCANLPAEVRKYLDLASAINALQGLIYDIADGLQLGRLSSSFNSEILIVTFDEWETTFSELNDTSVTPYLSFSIKKVSTVLCPKYDVAPLDTQK